LAWYYTTPWFHSLVPNLAVTGEWGWVKDSPKIENVNKYSAVFHPQGQQYIPIKDFVSATKSTP